MPNTAAKRVIEAYLGREKPGYALLVDAPWGSGKTHTLRQVTAWETDQTRLYVPLYEVHDRKSFDKALVHALNPWVGSRAAKIGRRVGELAAALRIADLSKIDLTEIALDLLPDTLIFDDVERCGLSHEQLSGLINRFVEHQGKRVILIANTEKHPEKDRFDKTREKLIGQTVTLKPDLDAALAAAWGLIPDGKGKTALQARQPLVARTFHEAGHQNLRLLLRALRDCAGMLDALTPDMLAFKESVDTLVTTFLALHMAYHGGELTREDLGARSRYSKRLLADMNGEEPPEKDAIEQLQARHPECRIESDFGAIMPDELALSLIADGFCADAAIRAALVATHQFTRPAERPDWVRLWQWDEESAEELDRLTQSAEARMENLEVTRPWEILHLLAAWKFRAIFSPEFDRDAMQRRAGTLVDTLIERKLIPARMPKAKGGYGFILEEGEISAQSRSFEADEFDRSLAQKLRDAMDDAYARSLPEHAKEIMRLFETDTLRFLGKLRAIDGDEEKPIFGSDPILDQLHADRVAKRLLILHEDNRVLARHVGEIFTERRLAGRERFAKERPWFEKLEAELIAQAKAVSPTLAAQMRLFIRRHLTPR